MTNKWKLVILFFFSLLTLTGCMQVDMHVTVNKDGSGIYEWKFLTNPYLQAYVQQLQAKYQSKNYELKTIEENGKIGFIATKHVKNIAEQPLGNEFNQNLTTTSLLLNMMASNGDDLYPTAGNATNDFNNQLQVTPKFLTTHFLFHTNADMSKVKNSTNNPYTKSLVEQLKMRFLLTLPIKPSEHNANEIIGDGKTLIWNLQVGKKNPIRVGVDLPTPLVLVVAAANGQANQIPHFGVLALSWLLVIVVLVLLIIKLLRKLFGRKKPPNNGGNGYVNNKPELDESLKWDS